MIVYTVTWEHDYDSSRLASVWATRERAWQCAQELAAAHWRSMPQYDEDHFYDGHSTWLVVEDYEVLL